MKTETIKISLSAKKIIYFSVTTVALLIFVWLAFGNNGSRNAPKKQKEFVAPLDFGVTDPGFEGKIANFPALNAKASVDARGKIDGLSSLKISFSSQSVASVKVPSYFNKINEGDFYRFSFWAKSDSNEDKQIIARIAEKKKIQDLGKFSLNKNEDAKYFELNFQADSNAEDLIFTSTDGVASDVWIDDVTIEKINASSAEELKNLKPAIFGNTTWKNIDQSQDNGDGDSGDFLSKPARKIGQIFQPSRSMLSGVALKILRHGNGGTGVLQAQIREFDEKLGVISDLTIASATVNQMPNPEILDEIKKEEQLMREKFSRNEKNIKDGKISNDKTEDRYPDAFTQDQIDAAKTAKRAAKLEVDILVMKEGFNTVEEIDIPLATKLDSNKKYWIGIDNSNAAVDQNNYISVVTASAEQEVSGGFASEIPGTWMNSSALWFKTFYPTHYKVNDDEILSGATISDMGSGKLIYRYHFAPNDSSSLSGFSGRKIYDMADSSYEGIDISGNYNLSFDDFAVYKFNTIYSANKIIVRDADFDQSLALEISTNGENWEEIFVDNPAENSQSIDPIVFIPKEKTTAFYLRIKPGGNSCLFYGLSVEAELGR